MPLSAITNALLRFSFVCRPIARSRLACQRKGQDHAHERFSAEIVMVSDAVACAQAVQRVRSLAGTAWAGHASRWGKEKKLPGTGGAALRCLCATLR